MFSSFRNFLSRHKKKFIVSGVVIGGSILAFKYAQKKLRDFQEDQATEFLDKARKSQHFESTERTCNQTIMRLAPNFFDTILKLVNTEEILLQLRQNPDNKLELWEKLKILSFTHLTLLAYTSSMLVITLRVQLNLLGGYLYKDTTSVDPNVTSDIQQSYLSLIQHFLKSGLPTLKILIEEKVTQVMKSYDLKKKLTLADTEQIFWSIQMAINSDVRDPNSKLANYVMPLHIDGDPLLQKMFNETLDMLESDDVITLSTDNISRGFSIIVDNIAEYYSQTTTPHTAQPNGVIDNNNIHNGVVAAVASTSKSSLNSIVNVNHIEIPLAKLIPIINGLGSKAFNVNAGQSSSLSSSLVVLFLLSDKIKILGANVYEVFSQ